jgi:hypothetical protein
MNIFRSVDINKLNKYYRYLTHWAWPVYAKWSSRYPDRIWPISQSVDCRAVDLTASERSLELFLLTEDLSQRPSWIRRALDLASGLVRTVRFPCGLSDFQGLGAVISSRVTSDLSNTPLLVWYLYCYVYLILSLNDRNSPPWILL